MRSAAVLMFAAVLFGSPQVVSAQAIINWIDGGVYHIYWGSSTGDVVGWQFTVTHEVEVSELGCWNGDTFGSVVGLDSSHQVGIWDQGQTLIASVTVTPTSPVYDDFRYESVTPTTLLPAQVYTIGAMYAETDDDGYVSAATSVTTDPFVTWLNGVYPVDGSLGFVFPANQSTPSSIGRFGPNFRFTVVPVELQRFTIE